jgi:hypothetical protein
VVKTTDEYTDALCDSSEDPPYVLLPSNFQACSGTSDTTLPEIPLAAFARGLRNIENGKCDTVTDGSIRWRTQSGGSKRR